MHYELTMVGALLIYAKVALEWFEIEIDFNRDIKNISQNLFIFYFLLI